MLVQKVGQPSMNMVDAGDVDHGAMSHESGFDLKAFWQLLRWRGRLIVMIVAGTVMLTGLLLALLPPSYRATAVVMVDPRQPRITNSEAVIAGLGTDPLAIESQVDIIQSDALAKKVIDKLGLGSDPDFSSQSFIERLMEQLLRSDTARAEDSRLVSAFERSLAVRRRGLSYIIEISYFSRDPAKAARIANAVADAYLDDQRAAKAETAARASDWLEDRIEKMRSRVRDSERAVADYKSEHGLVDVTQGNRLINRQIEDLTQQLALNRTRTAEARARLERVQRIAQNTSDPATLAESLQSPVIAGLRGQYAAVARVEAESSALYGSQHPNLIAIKAQRADLKRQIDSEIERILAGVRNDYQVASSREATLEGELTKLKNQAEVVNSANVKLHELQREAEANRLLLEQFLNRVKETREQQSLQIAEARVVSPALTPSRSSRPTGLLLLAGGLGGLLLSGATVLLLEKTRRGLRTPEDVQASAALQTIGYLPEAKATMPKKANQSSGAPGTEGQLLVKLNQLLGNPGIPYVQNLRAVQVRLSSPRDVTTGDVLLILSASAGEGKTRLARDLALVCTALGMRTLLIDANPQSEIASRRFGAQGSGVGSDPETGLSVLDAGTSDFGIGQRRHEAFAGLLDQHRANFDMIIVDTPAILSVGGDVPFLAAAERALIVIEWDKTEGPDVVQAVELLAEHGHKIDGAVLNRVAPRWLACQRRALAYSRPSRALVTTRIGRSWRLTS